MYLNWLGSEAVPFVARVAHLASIPRIIRDAAIPSQNSCERPETRVAPKAVLWQKKSVVQRMVAERGSRAP